MSIQNQQIAQAIRIIEEQLAILKQAASGDGSVQEGVVGIFDGEFMVEESGKRHQVPPNYASKTMLVPGDSVRMIEDAAGGQTKYKQIGKVERSKTSGILVKKDGKFEVLTEEGSFKVLSAAIKHYNGEVGDQVFIQYPKQHVKGSWAAVEKVVSQSGASTATSLPEVQPVLAESVVTNMEESQPVSASHIAHKSVDDVPEDSVMTAPAPAKRDSAKPVMVKTDSASNQTQPKSKSSAKSKRPSQSGGGRPSSNLNSNTKPKYEERKPKAAEVAPAKVNPADVESSTVNVEAAFGEDDLI